MTRRRPRLVALVPIHNEAPTVLGVLTEVHRRVDRIIAVDDGSTDDTPTLLRDWARGRKGVTILRLRRNVGMAGALKEGFRFAERALRRGALRPDDVIVNIDADGQHRPEYIPRVARLMERGRWDVMLTRRDFSKYPVYKRIGNRLLTWFSSRLSGHPYRDVESGFRFIRARVLPDLLDYFSGWRYSCAQEIALITARTGWRVNNDARVSIAYYRPGTKIRDGFIVAGMALYTWLRITLSWKVR